MSAADQDRLKVFAGRAGLDLAQAMCDRLDLPLGQGRTDLFPDGELLVKVDEDVRGRDCFVVQSTSDPVNANLMELLIYIDCLRRASAKRITAVIPYFGYARQDRKDEGRVPITAKLVANLITAAGATRVVRSLLYEISPLDPVTFGGVGSMLMTVALLAALLPAVRAATMDPAEALRND